MKPRPLSEYYIRSRFRTQQQRSTTSIELATIDDMKSFPVEDAMHERDEIVRQALALTPEDRAFIADLLEVSLLDSDSTNGEFAANWTKEIDRRIEAFDRGETDAVDVATAMREMRDALNRRNSNSRPS